MGPVRARAYGGQQALHISARPVARATYELNRQRGGPAGRDKRGYVFGALWETTGDCWTACYPSRSKVNFIDFLCDVDQEVPTAIERIYAIMDNLDIHHCDDLLLFMVHHPRWEFVYQPIYAAYLNLIEPWWKVLHSLALKGHRFETWEEVTRAVEAGTAYWNAHKHPFVWGRRRRHQPRRMRFQSPFARYLKKTGT